jgi:mannose-6-phosphate isomerase class I
MRELIFFEPYFKQVLWGGHRMRETFRYPIPGDDTGEAWVISANPHGQSVVRGGTYDGQSLGQLWDQHRELFGNMDGAEFPLLVKIIDANDHLSIQVHPDDAYAQIHENGSQGKTECWYILDCEDDADIIIGHHAKNRKELKKMIDSGQWDSLLRKFPIHKGDFFYIPSGTIHAIRKGTLLLEVQQNSDTTYRLYDYDRLQDGKPRQLHLAQSLDVITCPHTDQNTRGKEEDHGSYQVCTLVSSPYFTVNRWNVKTHAAISQNFPFMLIDVTAGSGLLDKYEVKAGDHILVPSGYGMIQAQGVMELVVTHI